MLAVNRESAVRQKVKIEDICQLDQRQFYRALTYVAKMECLAKQISSSAIRTNTDQGLDILISWPELICNRRFVPGINVLRCIEKMGCNTLLVWDSELSVEAIDTPFICPLPSADLYVFCIGRQYRQPKRDIFENWIMREFLVRQKVAGGIRFMYPADLAEWMSRFPGALEFATTPETPSLE